jgi:hypothetical protein
MVVRGMVMEQYIRMLIARDDYFVPRPAQVSAFLTAMVQLQVIPKVEKICVSTPSIRVRTTKLEVGFGTTASGAL